MRTTTEQLNNKEITAHDLLNYGTISRLLSGTRCVITRNFSPKKHEIAVKELETIVSNWLNSKL